MLHFAYNIQDLQVSYLNWGCGLVLIISSLLFHPQARRGASGWSDYSWTLRYVPPWEVACLYCKSPAHLAHLAAQFQWILFTGKSKHT